MDIGTPNLCTERNPIPVVWKFDVMGVGQYSRLRSWFP